METLRKPINTAINIGIMASIGWMATNGIREWFVKRNQLFEGRPGIGGFFEDWDTEAPESFYGEGKPYDRVDLNHHVRESSVPGSPKQSGETIRNSGKHGHKNDDWRHYR